MSSVFRSLLASSRVSRGTREAITARDGDQPGRSSAVLGSELLRTLKAVVDRVIPQGGPHYIDLASCIDGQLADGIGDGWRFAHLPPDAVAYARALRTLNDAAAVLHNVGFAQLGAERQDELLASIQQGRGPATRQAGPEPDHLNAPQLRAWFEDVRTDAVRLFMAHPQTLEWLGYSGFANGGDGEPKSGFARVGIGEREPWEPVPARDHAT